MRSFYFRRYSGGDRYTGLIVPDWPLMVKCGETTRYVGDVLAGVVAETEKIAREAVALIEVEYKVLAACYRSV